MFFLITQVYIFTQDIGLEIPEVTVMRNVSGRRFASSCSLIKYGGRLKASLERECNSVVSRIQLYCGRCSYCVHCIRKLRYWNPVTAIIDCAPHMNVITFQDAIVHGACIRSTNRIRGCKFLQADNIFLASLRYANRIF